METNISITNSIAKLSEFFVWSIKAQRRIAKNTENAYEQDLKLFLQFHEQIYTKDILDSIQSDLLEKFFQFLKDRSESDSTIARRMVTVGQFLEFCIEEKFVQFENGSVQKFDKPKFKLNQNYSVFFEKDDFEKMRAVLDTTSENDLRLRTIIEVLYSTGLRVSELLNLKKVDLPIIYKNQVLYVIGKGGYERAVFFNTISVEFLQKYETTFLKESAKSFQNPFLFFSTSNGDSAKKRALSRQRIFQLLKDLALRANLDADIVFAHAFRHRLLTDLVLNGADLISVQKIAGHQQINTTARYTHIEDHLYEHIAKFHPLNKK